MSDMTQAETELRRELAATMRVLDASSTMLAEAQQEIARLNEVLRRRTFGITRIDDGTKEGG